MSLDTMGRLAVSLLEEPDIEGYPTEYLIARIRARRANLIKDWGELVISHSPMEYLQKTRYRGSINEYSKDGIWYLLWSEYRWIYRQMNKGLRGVFYYLFLYFEFKRLIRSLRYKLCEDGGEGVNHLLRFSLISRDIKRILREDELFVVIGWLEDRGIDGLKDAFSEKGISGLEERLMDWFFHQVSSERLHPSIQRVFSYIIDSVNIITIFKHIRWQIETPPSLIAGGRLNRDYLLRAWAAEGMNAIITSIRRLTGIHDKEVTYSNIEVIMRCGLMRMAMRMLRRGEEDNSCGSDIVVALDYILRLCIEVENLGLILYGEGLERDVIERELCVS
ncbi:MAG: hypothetical protein Fur0020_03380 [Thermodesulfovibrionia bacterium]